MSLSDVSHELSLNEVEKAIHDRRTAKILLPVELRSEQELLWTDEHHALLNCMLDAAAWAPFHKKAHAMHLAAELAAPMPWRFHVVGPQACTRLLAFLDRQMQVHADSKWTRAWQSKIKNMLAGCGVLVQATWLPDPNENDVNSSTEATTEFTSKNIEHVAAAGSAVQNLLLGAQSHQWHSYWSSGGILKDQEVFDYLGISGEEQLLGSVFLTPVAHGSARIIDGGLRDQRGERSGWVRWV